MSNYYRPYFDRDRSERERAAGWDRRREQRRRYGNPDDLDPDFGRERFEEFEDWERPRELSSSSFGRVRSSGSPEWGHFERFGRYFGRGPKGYQRTDERIKEEVCDRLTADPDVDATDIEVSVQNGEVTLEGAVPDRRMKRDAEDCLEEVCGVREIHNRIRVGSARAVDPRETPSEARENMSGVSRFWRSGH
jgi:hypothetical protein